MTRQEILFFIEKGILAPSGDNMQPWKFRLRGDGLELYLDPSGEDHFFEAGLRALYCSAGAVIENIRVAAGHLGYRLILSYFPDTKDPCFVAAIRFQPGAKNNGRHFPALEKRVTNRRLYDRHRSVDPSAFLHLNEITKPYEHFELLWLKNGHPSYPRLCRILAAADQLRFENKTVHTEFIKSVRLSRESVQNTRDGLDVSTFESGPLGPAVFRLLSSWPWLNRLNRLGFSRLFNQHTQTQMKSSHACGLICATDYSPESYAVGGELMQRIWHELTLLGLSVQPMDALPIFMINDQLNGTRVFTKPQRRKFEALKNEFYRLYGVNDQKGFIFLFRIGYTKEPSARSLRRPLESFISQTMAGATR